MVIKFQACSEQFRQIKFVGIQKLTEKFAICIRNCSEIQRSALRRLGTPCNAILLTVNCARFNRCGIEFVMWKRKKVRVN